MKMTNASIEACDEYTRTIPILASTPASPDGKQPAITEWDLERFEKNPVVLWAHDQAGLNLPIGTATDFEVGPFGLRMRVRLATVHANPLAEQVWNCVREKVIRAVSVGYEMLTPTKAKLLEVSFVPIGLDENAGTLDLTTAALEEEKTDAASAVEAEKALDALADFIKTLPKSEGAPAGNEIEVDEETLKRRISEAARVLSKHRTKLMRLALEAAQKVKEEAVEVKTDADHFDVSRLDTIDLTKFEKTQAGGRVIPARLTRVGVLKYLQPDGTYRRELRLPDEVFKADSVKSLEHAHVVDFEHHRSMVDTDSHGRVNLGSVTNVRRQGNYLVGDLRIDSSKALDQIENEERRDISCGYRCRLDYTPGEFEGEAYDCVQRDITYNHAALCPPNRGRAGPDVALRLDTGEPNNSGVAHIDDAQEGDDSMTIIANTNIIKVRLDGIEVVEYSPEHFAIVQKSLDKLRTDAAELSTKLDAATKRADAIEGERDGLKTQLTQFNSDAAEAKTKAEMLEAEKAKAEKGYVKARRALERATLRYFGGPDDDEDETEEKGKRGFPQALKDKLGVEDEDKKEEKSDALTEEKLDSMTDRELMLFGIRKVDPKFTDTGRSDDYVRARFDSAIEHVKSSRTIHGVVGGVDRTRRADVERSDASEDTAMAAARKARDTHLANLWKTPSK